MFSRVHLVGRLLLQFYRPDFNVAILAGGGNCFIVNPCNGSNLALGMSWRSDGMLLRVIDTPNDYGTVQPAACNEFRIRGPSNTIDLEESRMK